MKASPVNRNKSFDSPPCILDQGTSILEMSDLDVVILG